jgi:hypothetical protein
MADSAARCRRTFVSESVLATALTWSGVTPKTARRSAPRRFVPDRFAPLICTPDRSALCRSALLKFASVRFAPMRHAASASRTTGPRPGQVGEREVGVAQWDAFGEVDARETGSREVGEVAVVPGAECHGDREGSVDVGRHSDRRAGHAKLGRCGATLRRRLLRRAEVVVADVGGEHVPDGGRSFGESSAMRRKA